MPMTLRLTEEEAQALRAWAALEHRSMQDVTRQAVREYIENGLNGRRLTLTNDAAYDLVIQVASGGMDRVSGIARVLQAATAPRRR